MIERQAHDDVDAQQHDALHPVGLAVGGVEGEVADREDNRSQLHRGEVEVEGLAGEVVNLGNPHEVTIGELADQVVTLTRSASSIEHLPLPIDDPTRRQPDITKARRLLDWDPRVSLVDGLGSTLDYLARCVAD